MFPCWGEKVIAISQQVKEHLVNDFEVKENKIALISNGIDTQRFAPFSPQERRKAVVELGLSGGPVVGIIARLSDVKGHQYLIEAMKIVLEAFPHAQLLIVGEGKMKQELNDIVERLGIKKNVSFVASMSDTRKALAVMDVFVLPSLKEGLGLALMEAMASGVSVVGSDIGGIQSLIINNFNGLLVGPKDVQGLAAAILELLKEPEKRGAFAREARALILEKFSSEKMVLETERIYQECLSIKG
jgi:glycosyltransferase involved in cell wall biosynthesis